jgi:hypothetical protein
LPELAIDVVDVGSILDTLLDQAKIEGDQRAERLIAFATRSSFEFNEQCIHKLLKRCPVDSPQYVSATVLLLLVLYMRLAGICRSTEKSVWYWATDGGNERCSLDQFVRTLDHQLELRQDLLTVLAVIIRRNIIAQHIFVAIEKWRARGVNTFHFSYDNGLFEWLRNGDVDYSASRFRQAYDMLHDLGLFTVAEETGAPLLSELGNRILEQTIVACNG